MLPCEWATISSFLEGETNRDQFDVVSGGMMHLPSIGPNPP